MTARTALAAILAILALAAVVSVITCGGEHGRTTDLAMAPRPTPDTRIDCALLAGLHRLAEPVLLAAHTQTRLADIQVPPTPTPLHPSPSPLPLAGASQTVRVLYFYCVGDPHGAFCGNTASGKPVGPGVASCHPSRMEQAFSLKGWVFHCLDTGPLTDPWEVEIWCYSKDRWGFPPDVVPCPTFDDWETVTWD